MDEESITWKILTENKFLKHKKLLGKIQKNCMIRADIINYKNKNKNSEADVFGKYEDLEPEPSFEKSISKRTRC